MSSVRSIMKTDLISVGPAESVLTAAQRMSENNLGAVLVIEGNKLVGIFSKRDLLHRVVAVGRDPASTAVKEVATRNPKTISGQVEVMDCYRMIQESGLRHLAVVDDEGRPLGLIAAQDFLGHLVARMEPFMDMESFRKRMGGLEALGQYAESLK